MSEELASDVAGLSGKMDMVIEMLRDLQKDLKSNYMPSAQIEDRFKAQGERISLVEKAHNEAIMRIEGTMKTMDQDVKDKFTALAIAAEKQNDRKKESPFKVIAALGGLVVIIGSVISTIIWLIHFVK